MYITIYKAREPDE
jgi:hypothetical protein